MSLLLAVDVGNTNIVLGVFDTSAGERAPLLCAWRLATSRERTVDEYGLSVLALFRARDIDPRKVRSMVVSSVVPPLHPILQSLAETYFHTEPLWIAPGIKTGLKVRIENPQELGADRLVNAVAGIEKHGAPLIAVDFGTATSFDVVNAQKEFLGGLIAPGLKISAEALFQRASRLPRIEIAEPEHLIGRGTVEAMQSGVFWGYVGLVDGILDRLPVEIPNATVITRHIRIIEPDLTLEGLRLLWARNRGKA